MKVEQSREESLSAIGKAYIDMKNGKAAGVMIVVRDYDEKSSVSEVISYDLKDTQTFMLLVSLAQHIKEDLQDGH